MAYSDQMWKDAEQKCRLNDEDIAIAKRLGINPRSLIKNIPSKSEPWKAPVKDWLRAMDEKAREKAEKKAKRKAQLAIQNNEEDILNQTGWDENYSYRLNGHYSDELGVVSFDMSHPEKIDARK